MAPLTDSSVDLFRSVRSWPESTVPVLSIHATSSLPPSPRRTVSSKSSQLIRMARRILTVRSQELIMAVTQILENAGGGERGGGGGGTGSNWP